MLCLLTVTAAFETARWSADPKDASIIYFPATTLSAQYTQLAQTATLMSTLLASGLDRQPIARPTTSSGIDGSSECFTWPDPSSKEWESISIVTERVIAVLKWARDKSATGTKGAAGDAAQGTTHRLLLQLLLQLLQQLLMGKLSLCPR